jgi:hypothetical protein
LLNKGPARRVRYIHISPQFVLRGKSDAGLVAARFRLIYLIVITNFY